VVERLGSAVREAGESPSPRLPEIGGFLVGTVNRSRGVTIVAVDDFVCVECEHASGPSYFLSGSDQRRLEERIRRYKPARRASIVGFFRSNTRKEFALSVEDLDLMAAYFSRPSMVLLLVDAAMERALRGGFFIWEQRAIRTMKPYLEFPFDPDALEVDGGLPAEKGVVKRVATPALEPLASPPPPSKPAVVLHWDAATVVTVALGIALLAAAVHRVPHSPASPTSIPAPVVRSADRAAEHVDPPPTTVGEPAAAVPFEPPAESSKPVVLAAPPAASPAPQPNMEGDRAQAGLKTLVIPSEPQVPEAASDASLIEPPTVPMPLTQSPEPLLTESASPPPPIPSVTDPFVSIVVDPVPYERRGVLGRLRRQTHKETTFVPPALIQQRLPDVPAQLRQRIQEAVPITVKLYVNRTGSVEYSELLSDGTGSNRDLASLAVFASRRWQFSPAHEGTSAVPAEVLVHFRFGAGAKR
jgi:hypothetical protein